MEGLLIRKIPVLGPDGTGSPRHAAAQTAVFSLVAPHVSDAGNRIEPIRQKGIRRAYSQAWSPHATVTRARKELALWKFDSFPKQ